MYKQICAGVVNFNIINYQRLNFLDIDCTTSQNHFFAVGGLEKVMYLCNCKQSEHSIEQHYMKPLFIIPARGGSKGIPHKNIARIAGKTLVAYAIDAARGTGAPDSSIILSTDDQAIADAAREVGLPVPYMRPAHLATDTASSRDAMLDAMDWADAHGIAYDCVVLLQPTSPLRSSGDVAACMSLYTDDIDMAVSVTECSANPYYNCFEPDADGYLRISKGDGLITRRQDAPPAYELNGAVYVINPRSLRSKPMGAFTKRVPYAMPADRSIDIDRPIDLMVAEAILSQQKPEANA